MSPFDGTTARRQASRLAGLVDAVFGFEGAAPRVPGGPDGVRGMVPPAGIGGDLERRAPVGIPSPPHRMAQTSPPGPCGDGSIRAGAR
jgi:hypothetical protein